MTYLPAVFTHYLGLHNLDFSPQSNHYVILLYLHT